MSMGDGESSGRESVPLVPLSGRMVSAEYDDEDRGEQEDRDGNDSKGCTPGDVRGQTTLSESVVEGDHDDESDTTWCPAVSARRQVHRNKRTAHVTPAADKCIGSANHSLVVEGGGPSLMNIK